MADGILPIPTIPLGLADAAQSGVLIPFVGAGVSVLAGCPTWAQLADGALRACVEENRFTYGQLPPSKRSLKQPRGSPSCHLIQR